MKIVLVGFVILACFGSVMTACTLLSSASDRVASAIDRYCEEPAEIRFTVRSEINTRLEGEGHSIVVTCAGD